MGLVGPLHRVCRAAPSVLCVRLLHCLVLCTALHFVCPAALHLRAVGSGQGNSCNALPHCLEAVGSATPAMHCLTAYGQWAVELLLCTARLPRGSGQWNSSNAVPHCLGAMGSGFSAMQCHTETWRRWPVELLQCAGHKLAGQGVLPRRRSLPKNGTPAMHHCQGTVGSATPAM